MSDARYLAGDLSGIQRFVLRVKSAGKAQAKRLTRQPLSRSPANATDIESRAGAPSGSRSEGMK